MGGHQIDSKWVKVVQYGSKWVKVDESETTQVGEVLLF